MAENLILSRESSESEIKRYFNAVLKLSQSDNEFPINLDEVWMLVYPRKAEAVRALTSSEQFIENVDYQVFRKNAENSNSGMMKDIVFRGEDNQALTDSLLVAETFKKEPNDVIRAIDNLLQNADNECNAKVRNRSGNAQEKPGK